MANIVKLYTDGACSGNPGNGGWACVIEYSNGDNCELSGGVSSTTNNQMELMAVIQGLENIDEGSTIELYTDSTYVRDGLREWLDNWKRNGWKTASKKPVKNQEFWKRLDKLREKHTLSFHWVKGHNEHPQNERCDELAVAAIEN